jgi:charged multivesicular body protein 2A
MKNDIKRLTNRGEMDSVMIVCKDLVRSRAAAQKFMRFSSQLQALGLRIMTISAQAGAATALKGVTQAMHRLNQMMNVPEIQAIVQKFMMEDEMLDMKDDIANEAFDTLFDAEGTVDEDAATQYAQIFAEMRLPVPLQIAALAEVGAEPLLLP